MSEHGLRGFLTVWHLQSPQTMRHRGHLLEPIVRFTHTDSKHIGLETGLQISIARPLRHLRFEGCSDLASVPSRMPRRSVRQKKKSFCVCGGQSLNEPMVACDNAACPVEWYHFQCVGLHPDTPPLGLWYCSLCLGTGSVLRRMRGRRRKVSGCEQANRGAKRLKCDRCGRLRTRPTLTQTQEQSQAVFAAATRMCSSRQHVAKCC